MTTSYNGKPLHKLTKGELIDLCEKLMRQVQMLGGTEPADLGKDDAADWMPPKRVNIIWRGNGTPGGK